MTESNRETILIVDDEPINTEVLKTILSPEYEILTAVNGQEGLDVAKSAQPDIILLDIIMPGISGYEAAAKLKEMPETMKIPIIFVTALSGEKYEEKGLSLGAVDYITKPFGHAVVRARVRTHMQNLRQMREIERLCMIDALTGIPNRRSFDIRMEMEWAHTIREKNPLSLLMLDIDDFKAYNDVYGHPQGDVLLKTMGNIFKNFIKRTADMTARLGGEEFAVLLPNTGLEAAVAMAEQLRAIVEETRVLTPDGKKTRITVSIGVASATPAPEDVASDLIARSDACLYAAKRYGKNMVFFEGRQCVEKKPVKAKSERTLRGQVSPDLQPQPSRPRRSRLQSRSGSDTQKA
jgi:diguanylate cyclase (GGDEF)-like protein